MTAPSNAPASPRDRARVRPRLLLMLAALAFLLALGLPSIVAPLGTDQLLYALGARTVLDGGQLYKDFWEVKPPLIFLVYTVPLAIAGEHMEAVRALDLINSAVAMAGVYLLGRRCFGERAGVLGAFLYAFTYLTWTKIDLGEAESFMAAPLAFALYLYRAEDEREDAGFRAAGAGLLLGLAFALKATALVFVLALPAAELLLRDRERWTRRGAFQRLALAAGGFLIVQVALALYLAAAGALGDFIDIQRHYTAPYNRYRYSPDGSHLRFLLSATSDWATSTAFLVVPAVAALLIAPFRPRQAGAAALLGLLALLGVAGIWWQGKMFDYHWLVLLPLLAPLAGFALDQAVTLFATLPRARAFAVTGLLAAGLALLAVQPLLRTYDDYRVFGHYLDGSMSRRDVEAHYAFLMEDNHELVDYVKANSGPDDKVFVWGLWPQVYFWLDRPLVDRFVANHGLRATWAPDSWRDELLADLEADPPAFFAVACCDVQPWLVGTAETSDQHLANSFPALRAFLDANYEPAQAWDLFVLYRLRPAAVRAPSE